MAEKKLVLIQGASGLGKSTLCKKIKEQIVKNKLEDVSAYVEDIAEFHNDIADPELREVKIIRHKMDNISDAINDLSTGKYRISFVDQSALGFISWLRFGWIQGIYTKEYYKSFSFYIEKNIELFERKIKEYQIEVCYVNLVVPSEDILKRRLYGRIEQEDLAHHDESGLRLWEWNRYYPTDTQYNNKNLYDASDTEKVFEQICKKFNI